MDILLIALVIKLNLQLIENKQYYYRLCILRVFKYRVFEIKYMSGLICTMYKEVSNHTLNAKKCKKLKITLVTINIIEWINYLRLE